MCETKDKDIEYFNENLLGRSFICNPNLYKSDDIVYLIESLIHRSRGRMPEVKITWKWKRQYNNNNNIQCTSYTIQQVIEFVKDGSWELIEKKKPIIQLINYA